MSASNLDSDFDSVDRSIVIATQAGLPLVSRPYHAVAAAVGIAPADVIRRVQQMLDAGIIRRIGIVPNHYALGMVHNAMTVWDIADDDITRLGRIIGALEFVTHCYHRPRRLPAWPYNLFAMVHGATEDEVTTKTTAIADLLGAACHRRDVLISKRILKKSGLRFSA